MTIIKPNANFYSLGGASVHEGQSGKYDEYRRMWNEYPSAFILRDFPIHLDIEPTSACNLKCAFCDKLPALRKDQIGFMDFSLYKKIIDEGTRHRLYAVKLSYRGEPLLHRNISEMVAYAKKKNILDVYFNTNGMLLTKIMCEKLIDSGLDRLSVSVEGVDAAVFEKGRKGASFEVILRNIETLIELRKKRNIAYPKVRVQTVYFPDLNTEEYASFWKGRCDEVAAIDYKDASKRGKGIVYDWACPQLWQRMTIEWDGTVLPCNNDDLRMLSPGNVARKTIYECWHDDTVNEIRSIHRIGGSDKVADCDGCPWRTTQIKKLMHQARRV